jgi:hypothetical protein
MPYVSGRVRLAKRCAHSNMARVACTGIDSLAPAPNGVAGPIHTMKAIPAGASA